MTAMKDTQRALLDRGFSPGTIDGIGGPRTAEAFRRLLEDNGLSFQVSATATEIRALGPVATMEVADDPPPWVAHARTVLGMHERRNNQELKDFLKSDGSTLGDPAQLPWCGDFVHTCLKLSLPDEPFLGRVAENPYLARNWLEFGLECGELYGAVGIAYRGDPNGISGHVFFAVGQNESQIFALGGNQGNMVSIVPISRERILGFRFPRTFSGGRRDLPRMTSNQAESRNEA